MAERDSKIESFTLLKQATEERFILEMKIRIKKICIE